MTVTRRIALAAGAALALAAPAAFAAQRGDQQREGFRVAHVRPAGSRG